MCTDFNKIPEIIAEWYDANVFHVNDENPTFDLILNQPIRDGISDDQLVTRMILDWAISKLKGRRTCSEDLVVAEMLQALPDYCRNLLVELFNHRIRNENGNEVSSDSIWDQNIVTLLEKEANPTLPKQLRGITILAALQKLFLKTLGWWFKEADGSTEA